MISIIELMQTIKSNIECVIVGDLKTEEDFNKILWRQDDESMSTNNPHSELTWTAVKAEMDKL
tara:strand:- start:2 stop:190 length:189 start_codon:yes stop_codon:yes gene_type:complete